MAGRNKKPTAAVGVLMLLVAVVVTTIVVPSGARAGQATASVGAIGSHAPGEVVAGTGGQVFAVRVNYPAGGVTPPAAQNRSSDAKVCGIDVPPTDPGIPPLPTGPGVPSISPPPTDTPLPCPTDSVVVPPLPTPTDSVVVPPLPTPTDSLPVPPLPTPTDSASVPAPPGGAPKIGPPANFIQITVPLDLITLPTLTSIQNGFTCRNFPVTGRVVCRGGVMLPGQSFTFLVVGTIKRPDADQAGTWSVSTSDDDGLTLVPALASGPGLLDTMVRVLKVETIGISAPTEATDNTVTEDQDNVTVRCLVINAGSAPLDVTPSLAGPEGSTAPAAETLAAAGGSFAFLFTDVAFGEPGTVDLTCDAAATGADGVARTLQDVTVQSKIRIPTIAELRPGDVVRGASYAFTALVNKTGQVSMPAFATANLAFGTAPDDFLAAATAPTSLPAGDSPVTFTFASTAIPAGMAEDEFDASIALAGFDSNGAVVDLHIKGASTIVNDSLPLIDPILTPPPSRVPSQPRAAADGLVVQIGGTVTRVGSTPCNTCSIVSGRVLEYDAAMAPVGTGIVVTPLVTLTNGALGGSYNGNYDPATAFAQLELTVKDNADRTTSLDLSPLIEVDNIAPRFIYAATGGPNGLDPSRIDLFLTEAVGGNTATLDYAILVNPVLHAYRIGSVVTLQLVLPLDEDARPEISYQTICVTEALRNTPLCTGLFDRVGHPVAAAQITAFDGLLPAIPHVVAVDGDPGDPTEPRTFYSNDSAVIFDVTGVRLGHTVQIFMDSNGNTVFEPATDLMIVEDTLEIADCAGDPDPLGSCATFRVTSIPVVTEGTFRIFVRALDAQQTGDMDPYTPGDQPFPRNASPVAPYDLTLDFTKPVITAVTIDVTKTILTATFSEPVFGRDFAGDWLAIGMRGAEVQNFQIETVAVSGQQKRVLTIGDDAFDPSWTIVGAIYEYLGPTPAPVEIPAELLQALQMLALVGSDAQYHDRATNQVDAPAVFSCGAECPIV